VLANAFFAATVIFLGLVFWFFQECSFLSRDRNLILRLYGTTIGAWALVLYLNILAGVWTVSRRVFLKDTGRKLAHIEKQLRGPDSVSEELSRRIAEEE
jgi:hypothetical protein